MSKKTTKGSFEKFYFGKIRVSFKTTTFRSSSKIISVFDVLWIDKFLIMYSAYLLIFEEFGEIWLRISLASSKEPTYLIVVRHLSLLHLFLFRLKHR